MSIQLTTPISMGDLESSLTHAKITRLGADFLVGELQLHVTCGRIVDSEFVRAESLIDGKTIKAFIISGSDYSSIIGSTASAQGVNLYDELAGALYQWLLDNNHFAGTIV